MAFVLKKSRPVEIVIGEGENALVLFAKKVKFLPVMAMYQKHYSELDKVSSEAKEKRESIVDFPIELFEDAKRMFLDAVTGWKDVVDEDGNPVEYDRELLEDYVDHNAEAVMTTVAKLNELYGDIGNSEKNSESTSESAKVH